MILRHGPYPLILQELVDINYIDEKRKDQALSDMREHVRNLRKSYRETPPVMWTTRTNICVRHICWPTTLFT